MKRKSKSSPYSKVVGVEEETSLKLFNAIPAVLSNVATICPSSGVVHSHLLIKDLHACRIQIR